MSDNNAFIVFTKLLLCVDRKTGCFTTGRYALAELCNIKPSTVRDVLKRLEREGMIIVEPDYSKSKIYICKWGNYQTASVTSPSPARHQPVPRTTLNKKKKEKENIDTNVSNDVAVVTAKVPSKDIDEMFELWETVVGYKLEGKLKDNRYACSNLLKKYGRDGIERILVGVDLSQRDQMAPRISDFVSLQAKRNDLFAWGKRKKVTAMAKVAYIGE